MTWDNGQSLGLIDGEDDFTVVHRPEYKEEQIRVLVVAPLQKPVIKIIENTLEAQLLNAKLNKKKNKENSQNKRKSLIKVNE